MMSTSNKWNNGDLELSPTRMKRVTVRHEEPLDAAPTRAFSRVRHLAPAAIALPTLLQRPELTAHTSTTLCDDEGLRHHRFLALTDGREALVAGKLELELEARGASGALVCTRLTLTALSEQGNALFDGQLGERMQSALQQLGASLSCGTDAAPAPQGRPSLPAATLQIDVQADPDACFALACPVAELDWIDGWCFDLLYSDSGRNEPDNVFCEPLSGLGVLRCPGAKTIWYTSRFNAQTRRFQAELLTPGLTLARFCFDVDDLGDGRAQLRWSLSYSALSGEGERILAEPGFGRRAAGMLDLLSRSAKHYVETGELYRMPTSRRARVLISVLGAAIGRHVRRTWRRGQSPAQHAGAAPAARPDP